MITWRTLRHFPWSIYFEIKCSRTFREYEIIIATLIQHLSITSFDSITRTLYPDRVLYKDMRELSPIQGTLFLRDLVLYWFILIHNPSSNCARDTYLAHHISQRGGISFGTIHNSKCIDQTSCTRFLFVYILVSLAS